MGTRTDLSIRLDSHPGPLSITVHVTTTHCSGVYNRINSHAGGRSSVTAAMQESALYEVLRDRKLHKDAHLLGVKEGQNRKLNDFKEYRWKQLCDKDKFCKLIFRDYCSTNGFLAYVLGYLLGYS